MQGLCDKKFIFIDGLTICELFIGSRKLFFAVKKTNYLKCEQ